MPRSPRATITASAAAVIPARSASAELVSILATMPARSPTTSRSLATSAARRTNDRATNSTPAAAIDLGQHEVAVGRREHLQPLAGEVHAGRALRAPAALHLGDDGVGLAGRHDHGDVAVADDDAITRVDVFEQRRVVDGDRAAPCSCRCPARTAPWSPVRCATPPATERRRRGAWGRAGRRARRAGGRHVRRPPRAPCASRSRCSSSGAVAEVETDDVDAGADHRLEHRRRRRTPGRAWRRSSSGGPQLLI